MTVFNRITAACLVAVTVCTIVLTAVVVDSHIEGASCGDASLFESLDADEEPAGRRSAEEPAGRRSAEEPAGRRSGEEPAGRRSADYSLFSI